jgi:hypothetical protein
MYINVIHHKKFEQKIPHITLILKYICKISYFVTSIICDTYIPYIQNFQVLLFLKKND